jgi:oxaloacetate decarboxylase beta subunit
MFAMGNLMRESGVVDRLSKTAQGAFIDSITILLMLCIGASLPADLVMRKDTLMVLFLGLVAFAGGTAGGVLLGKLMSKLSKRPFNPVLGAAGVSAVPMAARVAHHEAQEANPSNFLLMHAMGPNVAGVIGSAVVAGVFLGILQEQPEDQPAANPAAVTRSLEVNPAATSATRQQEQLADMTTGQLEQTGSGTEQSRLGGDAANNKEMQAESKRQEEQQAAAPAKPAILIQ